MQLSGLSSDSGNSSWPVPWQTLTRSNVRYPVGNLGQSFVCCHIFFNKVEVGLCNGTLFKASTFSLAQGSLSFILPNEYARAH